MLTPQQDLPEAVLRQVGNDIYEGVETPQGLQLSRIHSTDPAMYLKKELSPGSFYKG